MENEVAETPWEDLRAGALKAYEEASIAAHSWSSVIPKAINFYFDHAKSKPTSATVPSPLTAEEAKDRSRLIQIAGAIAVHIGFVSPFADDHARATPRRIIKQAEKQEARLKDWAYEIRQIADRMIPSLSVCPHCFGERSLGNCQATQRLQAAALASTEAAARRAAEKWFANLERKHYATIGLEPPSAMPPESFTAQQLKKRVDELAAIITAELTATPIETVRPRVICLCGSTRFIEMFAIKTWELEREGNIVLGCTLLPMWYCNTPDHFGEATGTKEQCDALHLQKINLADEVFVLNVEGYIGESTRREIEYATAQGKPVAYLEPLPSPPEKPLTSER